MINKYLRFNAPVLRVQYWAKCGKFDCTQLYVLTWNAIRCRGFEFSPILFQIALHM